MKRLFICGGIGIVLLAVYLGLSVGNKACPNDAALSGDEALEAGQTPVEQQVGSQEEMQENIQTASLEELPETLELKEELGEQIRCFFNTWYNGCSWVSWGAEELIDHLYIDPRRKGEEAWYIELLSGEPCGEGEGKLLGYATVQHRDYQRTFLVTDLGVCEILTAKSFDDWYICMKKLLQGIPRWQISEEEAERYVHNITYRMEEIETDPENIFRVRYMQLWYDGLCFSFLANNRLVEYRTDGGLAGGDHSEAGRECLWFRRIWNGEEIERTIRTTDALPINDTYGELREYLQSLHPDLQNCVIFTWERDQFCEEPFVMLTTQEAKYAYFCREGQWFQIGITTAMDADYWTLDEVRRSLGYDGFNSAYKWEITTEGHCFEMDLIQNTAYFYFEKEISPGQIFSFDCRGARTGEEDWNGRTYRIAVSVLGDEKPFQVLEAESAVSDLDWGTDTFSFEDINADGYLDLNVLYYYGASSGTEARFVWSPSRGEFVRMPDVLENSDIVTYPETRRMNIHYHGSAGSGTDELYQWSGETDFELIRYREYCWEDIIRDHIAVDEFYYTKILSYDQGKEKVLTDYKYEADSDGFRYVSILYFLDADWEREVVVEGQDNSCVLRYAQKKGESDEDEREGGYLDYLFLFREDTCLISALPEQEASAAYRDIGWEEENQRLVVDYEDGTSHCYRWSGAEFILETEK